MLRRLGTLCFVLAAVACGNIIGLNDYEVGESGGGTTTTAATTGSSTVSTGMGGSGGGPCEPTQETCNGIDDDCDGLTDEPETDVGEGCSGCTWSVFGSRHYVVCPVDVSSCPGGTQLVVLQSTAEHDYVTGLVPAGESALLGLTQASGSPTTRTGWAWARIGMPIAWDEGQPDDSGLPDYFENDEENCGIALPYEGDTTRVHDAPCQGFAAFLVCEDTGDECIDGAPCALADGCAGVSDCSVPGGQCAPAPTTELCNGLDDDCNTVVDDGNPCECTDFTGGGHTYRFCTHEGTYSEMHCGVGFVPAMPKTAGQVAAILAGTAAYTDYIRIGVYQSPQATLIDGDWVYHDTTPFNSALWDNNDPDDGMSATETHAQDCGMMRAMYAAVHDYDCLDPNAYVCEKL